MQLSNEFQIIKKEIGTKCFNNHYREVFGVSCLDFANSLVINLPNSCYANCDYCIDYYLRHNTIDSEQFLKVCEKILKEFPKITNVTITGGSLSAIYFNQLINLITKYLNKPSITWNTNGININSDYDISKIKHINLHRNHVDEELNKKLFKTKKPILSIEEAKKLMKNKLTLRIVVNEHFNLEEYYKLKIPLFLNRLIPSTEITDTIFNKTLEKLNISNVIDKRRRNIYLSAEYKNIPIHIGLGDELFVHNPNRKLIYLNVVIIHRSGIVSGTWYEDDKVIYNPSKK